MTIKIISPHEFSRSMQAGADPGRELIDVRTPAEYERVHAEGAKLVPLDTLDPRAVMAARASSSKEPLYIICQSGSRAAKACERFAALGFSDVVSIQGGTTAWEQAGLPVVRGDSKVISLERQVRIVAGSLVLVGVVLGALVHPAFYALAAFMGAGLVFAGVSNWCGMAMVLAKMPWNRTRRGPTRSQTGSVPKGETGDLRRADTQLRG